MGHLHREALRRCEEELTRVEALGDARRFDEALAIVHRAHAAAVRAGETSAWTAWQAAMLLDAKGELVEALRWATEARRLDWFCPQYRHSQRVILRRIREVLCEKDRAPGKADTLALYQALQQHDAADEDCHLAAARHHAAAGRSDQARALVDAVLVLNPGNPAALRLKSRLLQALGEAACAAECRRLADEVEAHGVFPEGTQELAES